MPVGISFAARRRNAPHDVFRQRGCRHIDFGHRKPKQGVAHRAADDARFFAVAIEQLQQVGDFALSKPGGITQMRRVRHRVVPGTNLPPSICAGT